MNYEIFQAMAAGVSSVHLCSEDLSLELVRIPPGRFRLGSPATEQGHESTEFPPHEVTISQPFYLAKHLITQTHYEAVMGNNPAVEVGPSKPIEQITYAEARAFCVKLGERADVPVSLPTEARWEYACRAGTSTRFNSGDSEEDLSRVAWYLTNSELQAHPVGLKLPNAWGLYDMHGNVWEYCLDVLPPYDDAKEIDPVGDISPVKGMMRGGGWMHEADHCRAARRVISNDKFGGAGIRVAVYPGVAWEQ